MLKAYLERTETSQTAFASSIGVSVATVSRLISGVMRPSLLLAHRIERATDGNVPTETWLPTPTEEAAAA